MKALTTWFDGKKAAIGFALLWLVEKDWFLSLLPDGTFENAAVDILTVVGGLLAGVGVIHKWMKSKQNGEAKPGGEERVA